MEYIYSSLRGSVEGLPPVGDDAALPSVLLEGTRVLALTVAVLLAAVLLPQRAGAQDVFGNSSALSTPVKFSASELGDIDNDNELELVVVGDDEDGDDNPTTTLYDNDGSGNFQSVGAGLQGVLTGDVCLGDFDQDGDLDLFLTGDTDASGSRSQFTKLYENTDSNDDLEGSDFSSSNSVDFTNAYQSSCAVGNIDGNGGPDFIFGGINDSLFPFVTMYRNDYSGSSLASSDFTDVTPSGMDAGSYSGIELADFEDDGDLEVLILGEGSTEATTLYKNTDSDDQLDANDFGSGLGTGLTDVKRGVAGIGDLDGDDDLDVVLAGEDGNGDHKTYLHENTDSDGSLDAGDFGSSVGGGSIFPGATLGSIELGNLDTDNDLDLLFAGYDGGSTAPNASLYRNDNDGTSGLASGDFTEKTNDGFQEEVGSTFNRSSANLGDFTDDGNLDAVVTGKEADNGDPTAIAYTQTNPIPVEFTSFTARQNGSRALLQWRTASETNNAGFAVQRKVDGAFRKIGFVDGAGTTTEAQNYRFRTDELGAGTHTFRLKQVDLDGSADYSDPVRVQIGIEGAYRLAAPAPNPTSGTATLRLAVKERQRVEVTVYDLLGREVRTAFEGPMAAEQKRTLRLGSGLSAGTYLVRVEGEGFSTTERLTIAR